MTMGPVEYQALRCDLDADGILTVTINRPEKLNAVDTAALNELTHIFTRATVTIGSAW
jgi:enoyl-CoA hydratase/carnithine racemase